MAKQTVDIGVEGNDATGDSIRESFRKVNDNFTELYAIFGAGGALPFTGLSDTPGSLIGATGKLPIVNQTETALGFYEIVSNAGTNDASNSVNTILSTVDHTNGKLKLEAINTKLQSDPKPILAQELNANAAMAYSNTIHGILINEGAGNTITNLVADWNSTHPESTITADNIIIDKGYGDLKYVNVSGDTLTGHVSTIAGATGNQIPRVNEVVTLAGSDANRTMTEPLYLNDHPGALAGAGAPNGQEDYQAASKYYVDNTSFSSTTNFFVSTKGDDLHRKTPAGKEGRSTAYAYRTINAACRRAEQIIDGTPIEPGPYVQTITYNDGANNSLVTAVAPFTGQTSDATSAETAINAAKQSIIDGVIDYITTNVASATAGTTWFKFTYDETSCRRDTGLIIDSVVFDIRATGNDLSRIAGKRYASTPSGLFAITTQGLQTRLAITQAKTLTATALTNAGLSAVVSTSDARFDDVINLLDIDTSNDPAIQQGNTLTIDIDNGSTDAVDQGNVNNTDLIPGKVVVGKTSKAVGIITNYARQGGADAGKDRLTLQMQEARNFVVGEEIEYGNKTKNNQISILIESGIYEEDLPIKLPENCSLKGDEFRRVVIRPKKGRSTSPSANTYFYRDSTVDGLSVTSAGTLFTHPRTGTTGRYGRHYLIDPTKPYNVSTLGASNPGLFPLASDLIARNKNFIIEEVIQYVDATYPSHQGNTGYTAKCRRDTGYVLDGIISDLKIGGREATLKNQGEFYSKIPGGQETETIAAIAYIKTIAANVLANDALNAFAKLGSVTQTFLTGVSAEANSATNLNNLVDCVNFAFDANYNGAKFNREMDVLLCNDGTIVRNITVQKHGGFMMVLDPAGQILTRSPYAQTCTSFSQSKGETRSFAGGLFIDGYSANMPLQITGKTDNFTLNVRTDPSLTNDGLFIRSPVTPFPFFVSGVRYQVNMVTNYDSSAGTATLMLDATSNSGTGYTGSVSNFDIFAQSGGNRSMLANDFTQINDLGYGAIATNNALSELVSVFTYYCHTGYYADKGSQIRSLSGNNSYGIYGLVSADSDPDEIPTNVSLDGDMVFPCKIFNGDYRYTFASSLPGTVTVGETLTQSVTGFTAIVSYITDDRKVLVVRESTGAWDTTNDILEDNSTSTGLVPATATNIKLQAKKDELFVYAYDLAGFPLNVSEIEIFHPVSSDAPAGLYQPYEVTSGAKETFVVGGYDITSSEYTYGGSGSNASFKVTKTHKDNYKVTIVNGGTGYSASETITVPGANLGGATAANNATITIDAVSSGVITTASITGTPLLSDADPVVDGTVYKLSLGTGIEGTASNGLQALTPHDTRGVFRHKQTFVFNDVGTPPTRPSTALTFTGDADTSTIYAENSTYRTIGYGTTIIQGVNVTGSDKVVTFDQNYQYIDLTVNQTLCTTAENSGTIVPAIAGGLANKTLGANTGGNGSTNDTHIVISRVDESKANRLNTGQMLVAWGGKVHTITSYTERTIGGVQCATILVADKANSEINRPAGLPGVGVSLQFAAGLTLKAGLADTEPGQITVNISTCRATSHDMLDIGTGGFNSTNYPSRIFGGPVNAAVSSSDAIDSTGNASKAQVQERNKGRVFAVLTDQDGFFRVGRFFTVDQGTGSVTFNAALVLTNIDGIGFKRGVRVNEFSNDDTFTNAKGDAVPTQTAVESYINARLSRDRDGQAIPSGDVIPVGGGYLYKLGDTMGGLLDMGGNRISNLPAPASGSDPATKDYVDQKTDQLSDIGDVTLEGATIAAGDFLIFNGTLQNTENATVTGDVTFTRTGTNAMTSAITAGSIVDADIGAAGVAEIGHTKLNLNLATTRAAAPTGTAIDKRDANGIASFDSAIFAATDGFITFASTVTHTGSLVIDTNTFTVDATQNRVGIGTASPSDSVQITLGNVIPGANSGSDSGQNLGASGNKWNTVYATVFSGTATQAQYADLAENYLADDLYEPGTVLTLGGDAEVTKCATKDDHRVAGVVTTNPAHLMNSALEGDNVVGVALSGRVPCKVIGKVAKGDLLVTSAVPGHAMVNNSPTIGTVIGKAVGTKDDADHGIVEVVVGRV